MSVTAPDATSVHPDLVAAVRDEAGRSADRVGEFLRGLADRGVAVPPLSRETLLELSAALTLAAWERDGLGLGREAGLPDARTAVRNALATVPPTVGSSGLAVRVLGLFVDRTAWAARPHLGADIRLDTPDEDAVVEALAQYLWATRPRPDTEEPP